MTINTTQFTNTTGNFIIAIGQAINTESGGFFGLGILIGIYLVTFFPSLKQFGVRSAFGASAFVGVISAIFLRLMGWINDTTLYGSIVVVVGAVVILWFSRDDQ